MRIHTLIIKYHSENQVLLS
ncbi:Protein of unknown function [Bacillus mycoides]|uniref:Uncharacterized protein n=1 Tax=Bacillus mycoides TaxID=1405 RepID=A0A1C4CLS6_BACMY|nr:Protein of unknown function [Bacillus mycoides]SCC20009.1 Protein of unknown function [Bacillus mycoides]